ncbi:MAG: glycosyltransferase family 4 protein [Candidatus Hydrogenedentes bacterium]|nr:glycosyltransferase family 4 protein [Candidatus Hydrogenedentota bacterium]
MHVMINALQAGNRSGTGRYTTELVHALASLPDAPELTAIWPDTAPCPEVPNIRFIQRPARANQRILFDQWGMLELRERLGADVVHYPANFSPATMLRNLVLTVHDLSFLHYPGWFRVDRALYYRHAIRRSVRQAKHIIADSLATKQDLCDFLDVPECGVTVIPLGVSPDYAPVGPDVREQIRGKYGLPRSFFLFVGTLEPRKNLPRLVAAFDAVAGKVPQDLVIVGRPGWKTGAIDEAIAAARHRDRIHLPGFVASEDLPALLGNAHAFVWPSLLEGFGLPPLEAMACGVPVLSSNTSSIPEVCGEAALLVNPLHVDDIADGLRRLSQEEGLCQRLSEAGRARAARFTWRRTATATLSVYQSALY